EVPPAEESARLQQIAGRNAEPQLAYATDEDSSLAIDPEANQSDLGNDPLAFARRRLVLARELWDRWQSRDLKSGESYSVLRRTQVDYLDRNDVYGVGLSTPGVDYSLTGQVLAIQRSVLDNLMSETIAQRILDSEVKLDDPKTGFHLSELYESLHRSIWSELK